MSSLPETFIVFADDWGRHPSSCQHLFRHLLPEHPTLWVNTIGLRRPRLDWASVMRAGEKLRQWFRSASVPAQKLPDNLHVSNPRMWPWFSTGLDRSLNRFLLSRHLRQLAAPLPRRPIVVTTLPIVADLVKIFPRWRWVYYCVDDFSAWPGVDGNAIRRMEMKLVHECHRVIAVSETLQCRIAEMGRSSHLLTHGIDRAHWAKTATAPPMPEVAQLERPLVVFWGVIDRRMDAGWVRKLASSLERGTVLLVGPQDNSEPQMLQTPRVATLPPLPYERLPSLAREADVLIMPYADLPVTRAMQPLKLKEYLATSKPVVVRDLPANRYWADSLDLAATPEAFVGAVKHRLKAGLPEEHRFGRLRLDAEDWSTKAEQFLNWLVA